MTEQEPRYRTRDIFYLLHADALRSFPLAVRDFNDGNAYLHQAYTANLKRMVLNEHIEHAR